MTLQFTKTRLFHSRPDGLPLPGDILLFSQAVGFTRLVPWFTGSRYYHVALYEGAGQVLEARPSGVVRRDIVREEGNIFRIIPMPRENVPVVLDYARCCLGKKYDVLSVAVIVMKQYVPTFPWKHINADALVCGELVVRAWQEAGLDLFPGEHPEEIIPKDFNRFLPTDAHDTTLENKM